MKLNNMFLEGRKLFANLPRFQRNSRPKMELGEQGRKNGKMDLAHHQKCRKWETRDRCSFTEVTKNSSPHNQQSKGGERDQLPLSFTTDKDAVYYHENTFVGIVK